jgi:hypothetical protein
MRKDCVKGSAVVIGVVISLFGFAKAAHAQATDGRYVAPEASISPNLKDVEPSAATADASVWLPSSRAEVERGTVDGASATRPAASRMARLTRLQWDAGQVPAVNPAVFTSFKLGDREELASFGNAYTAASAAQSFIGPEHVHRLSASFQWGVDNSISGKMIKQADGVTTSGVPIHFSETSYDDVYGRMGMFKIGIGYRETEKTESLFNFIWENSSSEIVQVGTASTANVPLYVDFDDYFYWGIELGQRYFFARQRFSPYAGFLLGIHRYGDIKGTFINVPANLTPGLAAQDGKFFEKSWAISLGPTGGVMVPIGRRFDFNVELQLRFLGGLSDVDWLVEEGLRDINSESSRWSIPILIGARYRF